MKLMFVFISAILFVGSFAETNFIPIYEDPVIVKSNGLQGNGGTRFSLSAQQRVKSCLISRKL